MSEAVTETAPVVLMAGDRVKVATGNVYDATGSFVRSSILGKVGKLDFLDSYSGWYVRPEDGSLSAYVGAQFLTKVDEASELRAEVEKLTAEVARLTTARDAQATALAAFKNSTRIVLVREAEESASYGTDDTNYDSLLSELDLDGRERDFDLRVNFEGSFDVTITATSLDAAIGEASDYDYVREYVRDNNDGNWLDNVEATDD